MVNPLFGKKIIVTRPAEQAQPIIDLLEGLGAEVSHWPGVAIAPPADWSDFDRAVNQPNQIDWIVFTSANGVRYFIDRLHQLGISLSMFARWRLAAIGSATANEVGHYFRRSIEFPEQHDTAGFLSEVAPKLAGQRVAVFRAQQAKPDLVLGLQAIATVTDIVTYQQVPTTGPPPGVQRLLEDGRCNAMILSSSNIAHAVLTSLTPLQRQWVQNGRTKIVANSQATAKVVEDLKLPPAHIASGPTDGNTVDALWKCLENPQVQCD